MKALEKIVAVAFVTTTCIQLLWVYDAETYNDILSLSESGVFFLEASSLLLSFWVVSVIVRLWHKQSQHLSRFQLGLGVCALGSVMSDAWLLLACLGIRGGLRLLLIYGGLMLWTVGLALILKWLMSTAAERRKEIKNHSVTL